LAAALLPLSVSKPSLDGRWRCFRGDPVPIAVTVTSNGKAVANYPVDFYYYYNNSNRGGRVEYVYYKTVNTASNGVSTCRFTIPLPGNIDNIHVWAAAGGDNKYSVAISGDPDVRVPIGRNGVLYGAPDTGSIIPPGWYVSTLPLFPSYYGR
jgi:hypothetical protein